MILKPQDVVILLKLVALGQEPWTFQRLAVELSISQSEVHAGVRRAVAAGDEVGKTNKTTLLLTMDFESLKAGLGAATTLGGLDAGTHRSLIEASNFIQAIEERQGLKVGCLEEIAWRNGWITTDELRAEAAAAGSSSYGSYLSDILRDDGPGSASD